MTGTITAADAAFTLTIPQLFSVPVTVDNWSADRGWEAANYSPTDSRMSLDGYLNVGFQFRPAEMTLTLEPPSTTIAVFNAIDQYQRAAVAPVILGGELRLRGAKKLFTFNDGHIIGMSILPGAGNMLEAQTYNIRWRQIIQAAI